MRHCGGCGEMEAWAWGIHSAGGGAGEEGASDPFEPRFPHRLRGPQPQTGRRERGVSGKGHGSQHVYHSRAHITLRYVLGRSEIF